MKIVCLSVGKKPAAELKDSIAEYQKRLNAYTDFKFEYISSSSVIDESKTIMRHISADDQVILLDERGQAIDNQTMAVTLQTMQNQSVKKLFIVIGGAYGVSEELFRRSNHIWSLSSLVFPHQLVRLILAEQLYRSYNLLAGGNYHHS